jgi:hypothetical protein
MQRMMAMMMTRATRGSDITSTICILLVGFVMLCKENERGRKHFTDEHSEDIIVVVTDRGVPLSKRKQR